VEDRDDAVAPKKKEKSTGPGEPIKEPEQTTRYQKSVKGVEEEKRIKPMKGKKGHVVKEKTSLTG